MGDATPDKEQPSLEPPQLFGRRRKKVADTSDPVADEPTQTLPAVAPPEETESDTSPAAPPEAPAMVASSEHPTPDAPLFTEEAAEPSATEQARGAGGAIAARLTSPFRSGPARPPANGRITSAVTGLVVGLVVVGLTAAAFQGCESVRNTATCGGGPGFVFLVLILAAGILVGRVLLGAFQVPDPGSTSFLAVGLTAVIVLLFFIDLAMSWPMVIIVPLLGVATFLASYWLTTTYVEPAKR